MYLGLVPFPHCTVSMTTINSPEFLSQNLEELLPKHCPSRSQYPSVQEQV